MKTTASISASTQLCAVIGNPIGHSLSPAIHNAGYAARNLDFVYVAFQVENLRDTLAGLRAMKNFRGLSITIPHKTEALQYVDEVAPIDRLIGSINTVVSEQGRLFGFSTDGPGALKALTDAGVALGGKRALLLGAGGAARAIAFTLAWNAKLADLTILDVNEPLLERLTADLEAGTQAVVAADPLTPASLAAAMAHADVIIHCTPIGMHPNEHATLVPRELFRPGQVLFDIVYTPLQTRLLLEARASGLTVIPGLEMFLNQAVLQFERFTGVPAPVEAMREVLLERLRK